jgi:hypothetical protein
VRADAEKVSLVDKMPYAWRVTYNEFVDRPACSAADWRRVIFCKAADFCREKSDVVSQAKEAAGAKGLGRRLMGAFH